MPETYRKPRRRIGQRADIQIQSDAELFALLDGCASEEDFTRVCWRAAEYLVRTSARPGDLQWGAKVAASLWRRPELRWGPRPRT